MIKALIFGGTTEGRIISQTLSKSGIFCDVHVATEYGEQVLEESDLMHVTVGRLGPQEIKNLCESGDYDVLIDATHPFATAVTENIKNNAGFLPYIRFERSIKPTEILTAQYFDSPQDCISQLEKTSGKILLTTGSKDLHLYCQNEALRNRLVVRVLPAMESLKLCYEAGLEGKQILAMQGPFSTDVNRVQLKEYGISILVTKESGKTGGVDEKLQACQLEKVTPYIIKNPSVKTQKESNVFSDYNVFYKHIEKITGIPVLCKGYLNISLAGLGPGASEYMTEAVSNAISKADYVFGAQRMIDSIHISAHKFPYYLAKDILPILKELQTKETGEINIVILFSGDTGFFSGQSKLRKELELLENSTVIILPGLSSIQVLSAKTGIDWQDAEIISMHGIEKEIWLPQLEKSVSELQKIFLLTSGPKDIHQLGNFVKENNLEKKYTIFIGYNLSYDDEKVCILSAAQCLELQKNGLYCVMLVPDFKEGKI